MHNSVNQSLLTNGAAFKDNDSYGFPVSLLFKVEQKVAF